MAVQNEWSWIKGQLDLWCFLMRFNIFPSLNSYRNMNILRFFQYKYIRNQIGIAVKKIKVNIDSSFVQTRLVLHP